MSSFSLYFSSLLFKLFPLLYFLLLYFWAFFFYFLILTPDLLCIYSDIHPSITSFILSLSHLVPLSISFLHHHDPLRKSELDLSPHSLLQLLFVPISVTWAVMGLKTADASGLHWKTKQNKKPFPPRQKGSLSYFFFPLWKTEAKFLFSNGSAFPIKVLCGDLGIVLLEPPNSLHLQIQTLREKKEKSQVVSSETVKQGQETVFALISLSPKKRHFCLGVHWLR